MGQPQFRQACNCRRRLIGTLSAAAALLLAGSSLPALAFDFFGIFTADPVDTVRQGLLEEYSATVKVGPALEQYFDCVPDSQRWQSFTTRREESVVSYRCTLRQFRQDLGSLGIAQNVLAFGAGLQALFANPGKGTENFDEQSQLMQKALQPDAVSLKSEFILSLSEEGKFAPRSLALEFKYPDGRNFSLPISINRLQRIFADQALFESGDKELASLILELPTQYAQAQPEAGTAL